MKIERDERRFDFHGIGLAIKRAREASGMTQEQLGYIVDRDPRTIMYHENDGQHPSLNAFYQLCSGEKVTTCSLDLWRGITSNLARCRYGEICLRDGKQYKRATFDEPVVAVVPGRLGLGRYDDGKLFWKCQEMCSRETPKI